MKRKIIVTGDGSKTIQLEEWNEQYHSIHGAVQEAQHVFIKNGFHRCAAQELSILEIGFGTGLNAFITFLEAKKSAAVVDYVGIEAFPISSEEIQQLNYVSKLGVPEDETIFLKMHTTPWQEKVGLSSDFSLTKLKLDFAKIDFKNRFDLIYFDAFGPRVQPELWTEFIFRKMFKALKSEGWLTTYSAKGDVRRAMQAAGFLVERTQGPPGKREMLVAKKIV